MNIKIKDKKKLIKAISVTIIALVIVISVLILNGNKNENENIETSTETINTQEIKKREFAGDFPYEEMTEEELKEEEKRLLENVNDENLALEIYYKLAKIKILQGELEQAVEYANKAISLNQEEIVKKISEDETFEIILDKLSLAANLEENDEEDNNEQTNNNTGNNSNSKYYIKVNNAANVVTVYTKDADGNYTVPVKAMICSTGTATPKSGVYSIKTKWTWGYLFGNVWGHYTTKIVGNILFHSVPYLSADPSTLEYWEYDKLGTSASMGCVRLKVADAKWIFDNMPYGTPVEFYSDSNPGPLGKPGTQKISGNEQCRGWDPTDPDSRNPWNKITTNDTTVDNNKKEETTKAETSKEETKKEETSKNETQANNTTSEESKKTEQDKEEKKENTNKVDNNTNNNSNTNSTKDASNNKTNNNTNTNTNTKNNTKSNNNTNTNISSGDSEKKTVQNISTNTTEQ